jgi:hypothetical protein
LSNSIKDYRNINLILASIIAGIFIYSAVFSYEKANHPIPSFHTQLTGEETLSTGLSRSFSAIVRLEFDIAHQFNPYGLRIFLFFLIQFFLRFFVIWLLLKSTLKFNHIVLGDSIVSVILLLIHFEPFIRETVYR